MFFSGSNLNSVEGSQLSTLFEEKDFAQVHLMYMSHTLLFLTIKMCFSNHGHKQLCSALVIFQIPAA